ncbi:MAG: adaptor protein MecA [Lachnospiraceae bacterium]|nr:adaptor protein MecA [Lachnospiraceae bacterium]
MKIERLSENQIRCILTGEDLAARQLKLSELAYGTEKAKRLFSDMMQQASALYGFDAENFPLMIEAVPLSSDSIALIVTKVENPEELDTRFSSFAPSVQKSARPDAASVSPFEQLLNSLRDTFSDSLQLSSRQSDQEDASRSEAGQENARRNYAERMRTYAMTHRLYTFDRFSDLLAAAARIGNRFTGESSLFRDPGKDLYYLLLVTSSREETMAMQSVLAALSEYGTPSMFSYGREQSLLEHFPVVIGENALQTLSGIR